ncbi:MAG: hypothetical protein LBR06_09935 [Bacteroidales bacterium]|jgi:hypothetical protein|nr:hypothetical protein [Bacteroidales bacterium]
MFKKVFIAALIVACYNISTTAKTVDGYPVANFALTVNAAQNGDMFGEILHNTGRLGPWLANRGAVQVLVEKQGHSHPLSEFKQKKIDRLFPFVHNEYKKSPLLTSEIIATAFCPLAVNDAQTSALPVLMLEITCINRSPKSETFALVLKPDSALMATATPTKTATCSGAASKTALVACDTETRWGNGALTAPLTVAGKSSKTLRFALAFHDSEWVSVNNFAQISDLATYVYRTWSALKDKTAAFAAALPATGDRQLDEYLRWYMTPGISLTRITKNNEALTMGYCELNQRDSYWTSWLHLVLFRDLEETMLNESVQWQQPSGKIPTTILPLIERHDDIDINAFFILRAARFYRYYHDTPALNRWMPALKKAMDWLLTRDAEHSGLPMQVSFWGDWKDVKGVTERKYSPFSGLLYLAALKEMRFLCNECADTESDTRYASAYEKGFTFINMPVADGGLWNGNYYCQRWKDGSVNDKLLQDQTAGILFGVIPPDRAEKIIDALNSKSMTQYGIAETFPYYPESFGYKPATYHNGAVWPWLSFVDCWARIRIGRTDEAIALVKKVAQADLVASGDWSPNEHINSLTGENLGFRLQGWNAGLFGLVYFGLLHPDVAIE